MKKRSSESPLRRVSGPSAASTQPFRGLVALGCFLSAVLVAAVVSDGAFDSPRQDAARQVAGSAFGTNDAAGRLARMHEAIQAVRGDLTLDFTCEDEGEWFDWHRLRRNFPFLSARDEDALSQYGISVDVSGSVAVVGAHRESFFYESPGGAADDDEKLEELSGAGAVYIFRFVDGEWVRVAKIEPPMESLFLDDEPLSPPRFGRSVAVASSPDEDVVVIGAPQETVLFFEITDDGKIVIGGIPFAGSAHVYRRIGETWPAVAEEVWVADPVINLEYFCLFDEPPCTLNTPDIVLSSKMQNDFFLDDVELFGLRVDILPFRQTEDGWVGGDVVAVGAPNGWGFPHCENFENPGPRSGTVALFRNGGRTPDGREWPDGVWVNEGTITNQCTVIEGFGVSVDLKHSMERDLPMLAAGADRGNATIPNPDDPKETMTITFAGAAVLYEYRIPDDDDDDNGEGNGKEPHPTWNFVERLQSPVPRAGEFFGRSVAIQTSPIVNDAVVVGAVFAHADDDDGVPGGRTEGSEGAAYVFRHTKLSGAVAGGSGEAESEWLMEQKLISLLPQRFGEFGSSIGASGSTVVVGAPFEGEVIDPNDPDGFIDAVGFAYMFAYDGNDWSTGDIVLPYGPSIFEPFDQYGTSVAIDGNVILVGAPSSDWPTGELDDQGDEIILPSVGSVFTYGRCFDADGPNDCFETSPDPGCNSPECVNAVCVFDASCCEVEWGQQCVDLALTLPGPCGFPIENCPGITDCCTVDIDNPGCNDSACCAAVCTLDPFCCEINWDECCVALAEDLCAVCPQTQGPSCEFFCGFENIDGCGTSCDAMCFEFGDCASDACIHCLANIPDCGMIPDSCQGYCGGSPPDGCSCDENCADFGDCCADVCDHCGYFPDCQSGVDAPAPPNGGPRPDVVDHLSSPAAVSRIQEGPGPSSTAPNRR